MGAMGTAWRKSTRVPALRVPVLLMGLGQAARALRQPSEASTPPESTAPDSASARAPPGSTSREARRGVANLTGECPRRARARQLHRQLHGRVHRSRGPGTEAALSAVRRPAVAEGVGERSESGLRTSQDGAEQPSGLAEQRSGLSSEQAQGMLRARSEAPQTGSGSGKRSGLSPSEPF